MLIVVLRCFRKILGGFADLWSNQLIGVYYFILLHCVVRLHFISYWKKQNQSIRGNGKKQYQDSPNPKKRANGIHNQPAKQQNPLVVRVYNAHAKAVHAFQNGARALSRHFELLYWQDFYEPVCVLVTH